MPVPMEPTANHCVIVLTVYLVLKTLGSVMVDSAIQFGMVLIAKVGAVLLVLF